MVTCYRVTTSRHKQLGYFVTQSQRVFRNLCTPQTIVTKYARTVDSGAERPSGHPQPSGTVVPSAGAGERFRRESSPNTAEPPFANPCHYQHHRVGLLSLAANDHEAQLADELEELIELANCRPAGDERGPGAAADTLPKVTLEMAGLASYHALLVVTQ